MNYFYGPVYSRRLGNSLGVGLVPKKVCTFDCVYCQVKIPQKKRFKRATYIDFFQFKKELKEALAASPRLDYITFSGSGEPTLHKNLDKIIKAVKKISRNRYPICVITNSSLLYRAKVRQELKEADLVIPSLDAFDLEIFQRINRPHPKIKFKKITEGLINFRREFKGQLWLEIMILGQINDDLAKIHKFKKIVDQIKPDKVQINLPVRPSLEKVSLPKAEKIKQIKDIIGGKIEIVSL